MTFDEIKQLLEVVREHELSEFELERDGFKIRVVKQGSAPVVSDDRPRCPSLPRCPSRPRRRRRPSTPRHRDPGRHRPKKTGKSSSRS